MAIEISGLVNWLKGWFYDKSEVYKKEETYSKTEVNNALSNKLNSNLVTANKMLVTGNTGDVELADKIDISGKIDTAGTGLSKSGTTLNHSNSVTEQTSPVFKKIKYDEQGHITGTAFVTPSDLPDHDHAAIDVIDSIAHSNIGTDMNARQNVINGAIDTAIGNLQSIKAIEVVSDKGTATADKLGKLFIVSESSKVNVYYVKQTGSGSSATYSWEKMDANILDELVINWSDVQNNPFSSSTPSSFANATHTHSASDVSDANAHSSIATSANANQQAINTAIDNQIGYIYTSLDSKAPKGHTTSLTTYGVGTSSAYGHNKVINNLTTSSHSDGTSLSAYQGYVLKGLIDNLESDVITSIVLVPKNTDANGKIIFYTGDEPTP